MPGMCLSALLGVFTVEQRRSAGTDSKRLQCCILLCEKDSPLLSSCLSEMPLERNLEQGKGPALLTHQENIHERRISLTRLCNSFPHLNGP